MAWLPGTGTRSRSRPRGEVNAHASRWTPVSPVTRADCGASASLASAGITVAGAAWRVMTPGRASAWGAGRVAGGVGGVADQPPGRDDAVRVGAAPQRVLAGGGPAGGGVLDPGPVD